MNIYDYDSYDYQSFYDEYLEYQYTYFGKLPTENDDFFYNMQFGYGLSSLSFCQTLLYL